MVKSRFRSALAAMLAALMALAVLPFSALRVEAAAESDMVTKSWTVPEGYNAHDYNKCAAYLEQTDANGRKNGEKLSNNYDPNNPGTWGSYWDGDRFKWTIINGEKRIQEISVSWENQCGTMDVSGCTALETLGCSSNNLNELDVSGCTALTSLNCSYNNLSELDLSNNPELPYDHILSEGDGCIGYRFDDRGNRLIEARPASGASFEGFYDENGALISEGEWSDEYEAYIYEVASDATGTIIARFSDSAAVPGDADGSGSVTVADTLSVMRLAMSIADGSGMNTGIVDMDGDGRISMADALIIMRIAMGIATA